MDSDAPAQSSSAPSARGDDPRLRADLLTFGEVVARQSDAAESAAIAAIARLLGGEHAEPDPEMLGVFRRWLRDLVSTPFDDAYAQRRIADARFYAPLVADAALLAEGCGIWLDGAAKILAASDLEPKRQAELLRAVTQATMFDAGVLFRSLGGPSAAALEALQDLNDRIIAAVPDGLVVVDEALRVLHANQSFTASFGLPDQSLVGRRIVDVLDAPSLLAAALRVRDTGAPANGIELRLPVRDGGADRPVRISILPLGHGPRMGHGLLFVVQDLSEAEQIKAQALEAERRLQELVEHAADAVLLVDHQGRMTYVNAAAERMFGYRRDELHGVDAPVVLPDGFFTLGDRHLARQVAKGETVGRMPVRAMLGRRKDGTSVPVEGSLAAWTVGDRTSDSVIYAGVLRDVSVRRKAEEALRRSEASFRALIENSPDGLGIHRDLRLVYVNPALRDMLGYATAEDLLGRLVLDIVDPEDRDVVGERTRHVVIAGGATKARECRLLKLNGSPLWVELVAVSVIYDSAPAVVYMARDVSERKAIQARMSQADRIMSVGTLAAGVAHEINNPLTYVITNLGFIARELGEIQDGLRARSSDAADAAVVERLTDVRQALAEVRDGTDRVRVIVRDLRTFSRSDDERRGRVDVRTVMETGVNIAWNHIRQCARLVKDYQDVPPVEANEARLSQVFLNLLLNAAQAIPEGYAARNEIRVVTRLWPDGRVCVEVRDTGVGIAPEHRARVFDPFFTTKPVGLGTGLGLAVCSGIVAALSGEMEVESEVGRGTTFRVLLPAAVPDTGSKAVAMVPEPVARRGRILVVDDEPTIGVAIGRALGADHEVAFSSSARDALRRLISGEDYEIILCDLMMPEMTGMDLHATIERMLPAVAGRLVFLTGGAFTPRARAFLDQVPNARLDKPFEEEEIRLFVRDRLA